MQTAERPRRFIVIPKDGLADETSSPAKTARWLAAPVITTARAADHGPAAVAKTGAPALTIVNTAPADGSVLVDADHVTLDEVKARAPEGAKVFEEQWYPLERARGPWQALRAPAKASGGARHKVFRWTVTVRVDGDKPRLLGDALVTAMLDEDQGIGIAATTDRYGRAQLDFDERPAGVQALYVDPLHGGWPVRLEAVAVSEDSFDLRVPPVELHAPDARGLVYGRPAAVAGQGVTVGVVDTGVGPHEVLAISGGRNTTEEQPRRWRDWDGHGTHVAGVVAATASEWRRGEASHVQLHAYRIFEDGVEEASTFAIAAAIKQAALDGCDLVNLSIGGSTADGAVRDAVEQAWGLGCVCVAATGNDGRANVAYPARYPKAVAVSAIGLHESWPTGAHLDWTLSAAVGKHLGGKPSFLAKFSNRGDKVALTAPGVAIVSTIPNDRWGVMSGTSMATPVATGVLARRLAGSAVLAMPRDARRAEAILALASEHAEDLGLPAAMQGKGLAR
ncbi:MAG TPA: S8 family serine peptidase [Ideonella sp.]|uniref:S8 family serine peptidase n=1 Tax=Ideonella sp. TaxID=1929293 RepID=UPI002E35572D|nr:S8 family serine peptidase [Ideonella sp.]HEX5684641.1 S8 family serine peptidase [Ideonella sp.]